MWIKSNTIRAVWKRIEQRLELLRNLERKYGGSLERVLEYAKKARQELDQIAHSSERIAELEEEEKKIRVTLSQTAILLSQHRKVAAKKLASAVENELTDLSMPGARFEVGFSYQADPHGLLQEDGSTVRFDETGIDAAGIFNRTQPG